MKKISFAIMAGIAALAVCSCGTGLHLSNAVNQFGAQTVVTLSQANFRIVRNVEAVIEVNNSNLRKTDVEKSAYAQLLRNANLQGSQALINVVIEEVRRTNRTLLCGPKHKQYVAARATIIEFIDGTVAPSSSYVASAPASVPVTVATSSVPEPTNVSEEHVATSSQSSANSTTENLTDNTLASSPVTFESDIITIPSREGVYSVGVTLAPGVILNDIYTSKSWIKEDDLKSDGRIYFSAKENKSKSPRTATLFVYVKEYRETITVTVTQEGKNS